MLFKIRAIGIESTVMRIERTENRIKEHSARAGRKLAEDIKDLAQKLAPEKNGHLVNSIRLKELQKGSGRGWRRKSWEVGVQAQYLGPGYQLKHFRYDVWTHDAVGEYSLGRKSASKNEILDIPFGVKRARTASGMRFVGPRYLNRAADYHRGKASAKFKEAKRKAIKLAGG